MPSFTILPILGLKTNVPADDPSLFRPIGDGKVLCHCVEEKNTDASRNPNSISRSLGVGLWSNSAAATTQICLGIFELYDGTNRVLWTAMGDGSSNGRIFRYDASRDPVRVSDVLGHGGAVEFASGATDFYSFAKYGDYMVFADRGEHTPYCADHNDTTLAKLISSGTEFKFRYLESWQNRIIGAYSDQTNGDVEIRWSNLLPVPQSNCVFSAGNQLYMPNDDTITGIKRMGRSNCFIYAENSINRLVYYPDASQPFSIVTVIDDIGTPCGASVVNIGGVHYFFNNNYGFIKFDGNSYTPISEDIWETLKDINFTSYPYIIGAPNVRTREIAWLISLSEVVPDNILYYNYVTNNWRKKEVAFRYIAQSRKVTDATTMQDLIDLGYSTWDDFGDAVMAEFIGQTQTLAYAATDGKMYYDGTDYNSLLSELWSGYRTEPVMDFGDPIRKDLIQEIWFNLTRTGDYTIWVQHRGGNTVGEVLDKDWIPCSNLDGNNPKDAIVRLKANDNEAFRYNQIQWSTGGTVPIGLREIMFNYTEMGYY